RCRRFIARRGDVAHFPVIDLLAQIEAAEDVGEGVAQRERASAHLKHPFWVLFPGAGLVPKPRLLRVVDGEIAGGRLALAFALDLADGDHLVAVALDALASVLTETGCADEAHGRVAPDRRATVHHSDTLQRHQ